MICRDAREDDVAWLAGVSLDNYRSVFAPILPARDWSSFDEAHFLGRFGRAWPRVRIVEEASPGGFALVTNGHIDMFFIDRTVQGRGFGRALLADAEARGAQSLESFAANLAARRFYERAGWRPMSFSSRIFAGAECEFVRYERR